jgi:uncharacterized membrane protein
VLQPGEVGAGGEVGHGVALDRRASRKPAAAVESASVGERWDTGRTEAFSDGVLAIAITLLVLDLNVPASELDDLWRGILDEWPAYLAYASSFLTIGAIWLRHHGIFARLAYVDRRLMTLNLLLLMAVSFLPFPTRLVAEAIQSEDAERVAVVFYGTTLLVISALVGALWATAARNRALLRPEIPEAEVDAILIATTPSIGSYIVATIVALAFPYVAAVGYLVIAIVLVLNVRGDTPKATPTPT